MNAEGDTHQMFKIGYHEDRKEEYCPDYILYIHNEDRAIVSHEPAECEVIAYGREDCKDHEQQSFQAERKRSVAVDDEHQDANKRENYPGIINQLQPFLKNQPGTDGGNDGYCGNQNRSNCCRHVSEAKALPEEIKEWFKKCKYQEKLPVLFTDPDKAFCEKEEEREEDSGNDKTYEDNGYGTECFVGHLEPDER